MLLLRSFLGWEDLEVVDPEAEAALKGDKTDKDAGPHAAVRLSAPHLGQTTA